KTMNFVHMQVKYDYKNEIGKIFNVEVNYEVKSYTIFINRNLKEKYKGCNIPTDFFKIAKRKSLNVFKINSKELLKGNASLNVFRSNLPIPVRGRTLNISEDYTIKLPFMTKELAESYGFAGRGKQSFEVQLKTHKNSKLILDRILSGEYKVADSK